MGTIAEARRLAMGFSAGLYSRLRLKYMGPRSWPHRAILLTDPARAAGVAEEIWREDKCCLDPHGLRRARQRMTGAADCLKPSFLNGFRAEVQNSGPTVSTVLEEQLHALVVGTVDSRMSRAKDASVALASVSFRFGISKQFRIHNPDFPGVNANRFRGPKLYTRDTSQVHKSIDSVCQF